MDVSRQDPVTLFVELMRGSGWHGLEGHGSGSVLAPPGVPLRFVLQDRELELDLTSGCLVLEFWLGQHEAERWLEADSAWGRSYRVRVRITPGDRLERLLRTLSAADEWSDPLALVGRIASSGFQVELSKGREFLPLTRSHWRSAVPADFDPVDALSFASGHEAESAFQLEGSLLPEAFQCLRRWTEATGQLELGKALVEAGNIPDFFWERADVRGRFDARGNLVGFRHGGDRWVFEWLIPLVEFIREGSYFLVQDQDCIFWRIEFGIRGVRLYRERLHSGRVHGT